MLVVIATPALLGHGLHVLDFSHDHSKCTIAKSAPIAKSAAARQQSSHSHNCCGSAARPVASATETECGKPSEGVVCGRFSTADQETSARGAICEESIDVPAAAPKHDAPKHDGPKLHGIAGSCEICRFLEMAQLQFSDGVDFDLSSPVCTAQLIWPAFRPLQTPLRSISARGPPELV